VETAAAPIEAPKPEKKRARRAAARTEPVETIEVSITSEPPGAAVIMSGGQLGLTPLSIALVRDRPIGLVLRLDGYRDRKVTIRPAETAKALHVVLKRGAPE
jgi:hypothetical protein